MVWPSEWHSNWIYSYITSVTVCGCGVCVWVCVCVSALVAVSLCIFAVTKWLLQKERTTDNVVLGCVHKNTTKCYKEENSQLCTNGVKWVWKLHYPFWLQIMVVADFLNPKKVCEEGISKLHHHPACRVNRITETECTSLYSLIYSYI